eukprot:TRINITY_DN6321_c0_g1_i1.p1 TRINITY_DN6321_c0_g1~~TRINITY_DN6321_c0_g1_i1.p1  ORF type:complete len:328 (+),score=120.65 TRINITY_DN6321_c0_g1_i1:71-1054(+)
MYTFKMSMEAPSDVLSLEISPDESYVAAACVDGYVRCYSSRLGKLDYAIDTMQAEKDKLPATSITFRPQHAASKVKNVAVVGTAKGTLEHYHLTTKKVLHSVDIGTEVYCVSYRPDGAAFACSGKDGRIRIGDEHAHRVSQELYWAKPKDTTDLPCSAHSSRVLSVDWIPESATNLISGGWDKSLQVWDTRTDHAVQTFYGAYLCGDAMRVCDDGYTVITASCRDRDQLQLFDLRKNDCDPVPVPLPSYCNPSTSFYSLALSGNGLLCAAGATDVLLFPRVAEHAQPVSLIWEDAQPVFTSSFSSSANLLAVGGAGGKMRLFESADY